MYIPFETLVEQLGRSIQKAQERLELEAVEAFFQCFENVNRDSGGCEFPLTRRVGLPAAGGEEMKVVDVPTVALLRHQSMELDCVKVRLQMRTQAHKEDNTLFVEPCSPCSDQDDMAGAGEVELTFKAAPPAEGIARLDLNMQKIL